MVLLNSDAGLAIWSVTKHKHHTEQYRWIGDRRGGFSLSDLQSQGYGRWCEHAGFALYIHRDLAKLTQAYALTVKEPSTVIWCDRSTTLRAVLRRLAREYGGEAPRGFRLFAKECRSVSSGWR